eukprot:6436337-Prymnesium_polylepis.2
MRPRAPRQRRRRYHSTPHSRRGRSKTKPWHAKAGRRIRAVLQDRTYVFPIAWTWLSPRYICKRVLPSGLRGPPPAPQTWSSRRYVEI